MVVAVCLWGLSASSAAAASNCQPIVDAGNENQRAFQAFTEQAYADGMITPEESAKADDYLRRQNQITQDLSTCIQTGYVSPEYLPKFNAKQQAVLDKAARLAGQTAAAIKGLGKANVHKQADKLGKLAGLSARAAPLVKEWGRKGLPKTTAKASDEWYRPALADGYRKMQQLGDFTRDFAADIAFLYERHPGIQPDFDFRAKQLFPDYTGVKGLGPPRTVKVGRALLDDGLEIIIDDSGAVHQIMKVQYGNSQATGDYG